MFSIDNHDMTVIEVEGTTTQTLKVNQIQILPAQRYSFVVRTYNDTTYKFPQNG